LFPGRRKRQHSPSKAQLTWEGGGVNPLGKKKNLRELRMMVEGKKEGGLIGGGKGGIIWPEKKDKLGVEWS